jgi:hypothetical protein
MADNNMFSSSTKSNNSVGKELGNSSSSCFKEAVCIDAYRVYDSCADKDCLQDLRVYFTESGQHVVDQACSVRIDDVSVITVYVNLEPVPFNKGFYSVDMTFFFEVNLEVFLAPASSPVNISGLSVYSKKVILFGSEGNVKIFSSNSCDEDSDSFNSSSCNLPKATVQIAEPIGLSAKVLYKSSDISDPTCPIPECICKKYGGEFAIIKSGNFVYVTIGIFTIVQIERSVQMLIPTYDFCVPEKECTTSSDDPCELFGKLEFPTDEFFPPRVTDLRPDAPNVGCSCRG